MKSLVETLDGLASPQLEIYEIANLINKESELETYSLEEREQLVSISELCKFSVHVEDGKIVVNSMFSSSNDIEQVSYPDFLKIKSDAYLEIYKLIDQSQCRHLKIHCFIILHRFGNNKNFKKEIFISDLLSLILDELKDTSIKRKRYIHGIITNIKIGTKLSISYKMHESYVCLIEYGINLLNVDKVDNWWLAETILEIIVRNRKLKLKIDNTQLLVQHIQNFVSLDKHPNVVKQISLCKELIKSGLISNAEIDELSVRKIQLYQDIIESKKFTVFVKLDAITECIEYYESCKNIKLVQYFKSKFDAEKLNIKMSTIQTEIPNAILNDVKLKACKLVKDYSPIERFFYITLIDIPFDILQLTNSNRSSNDLSLFAKNISIDSLKNLHLLNDDSFIYDRINYNALIVYLKLFLIEVFFCEIRNEGLKFSDIEFFFNSTWFSENCSLLSTDSSDRDLIVPQDVLLPSIKGLFDEIRIIDVNLGSNSLIPFIDSLVLKIEFIVRLIVKSCDLSTTNIRSSYESSEMTFEQLINALPFERFVDVWFGSPNLAENDKFLLNYLFTRNGLNLRNRIAHGLIDNNIYSVDNALLLFYCIIRLAKYRVPKKGEE